MAAKITRTSALACRHKDLGGKFEEYIRMAVPMTYRTDPKAEHNAVRDAAGMYDFTAFLKFRVTGPDAGKVIDHTVPYDIRKLAPGQSKYGPFLRETGVICDDGIVFNLGNDEYFVVHGDGCARKMAEESAKGKNAEVEYDGGTHLISLQGPKALEVLAPHTPIDLPALKYFHHQETKLFGCPCLLSRTGYSGERGYEVFVDPHLACDIWDNILGYGKDLGVMACSIASLFPLRLEAGLVWRRFDLMEQTPWEVGLGWTVDRDKDDFRGKETLWSAKGKERYKTVGLDVDLDRALTGGEKVIVDGQEVGLVNGKAAYSHRLKKSLAFARIQPALTAVGTKVEIVSDAGSCSATVVKFPLHDPKRERVHA
jgi:aminomethyltransferase